MPAVQCYTCGETGHARHACPQVSLIFSSTIDAVCCTEDVVNTFWPAAPGERADGGDTRRALRAKKC